MLEDVPVGTWVLMTRGLSVSDSEDNLVWKMSWLGVRLLKVADVRDAPWMILISATGTFIRTNPRPSYARRTNCVILESK